jgi:hypothetical protein
MMKYQQLYSKAVQTVSVPLSYLYNQLMAV